MSEEENEKNPGCCAFLGNFAAEEKLPNKDKEGEWIEEGNPDCGAYVTEHCMCYTCVCYKYKGCYFSATNAWYCCKNDNCYMGPCVEFAFKDKDTMYHTWLGCPSEKYVRKSSVAPEEPKAEDMDR